MESTLKVSENKWKFTYKWMKATIEKEGDKFLIKLGSTYMLVQPKTLEAAKKAVKDHVDSYMTAEKPNAPEVDAAKSIIFENGED